MNWQTYKIEKRERGIRRYRARSTYLEVNGVASPVYYSFTRRGAEKQIVRLRKRQNSWRVAA